MPNIRNREPEFRYQCEPYILGVYSNLRSFADKACTSYLFVVLIYDPRIEDVAGIITLEQSAFMRFVVCMFDSEGNHHNFGDLSAEDNFDESHVTKTFFSAVGMILEEAFGVKAASMKTLL